MPLFQPSQSFCTESGLPFGASEERWHPREFTFAGLTQTLNTLTENGIAFAHVPYVSLMAHSSSASRGDARRAALVVPVAFSPRNALAIADALENAQDKPRATFLFGMDMPGYQLADAATADIARALAARGHELGVLVDATNTSPEASVHAQTQDAIDLLNTLGTKTVKTAGFWNPDGKDVSDTLYTATEFFGLVITAAPLLQNTEHAAYSRTDAGVYTGAHPALDFAAGKTPYAVIELSDHAFSKTEMWPVNRLVSLPEISGNEANEARTVREYVAKLPHAILGQKGTTAPVTDYENRLSRGLPTGFRPQRHEISG